MKVAAPLFASVFLAACAVAPEAPPKQAGPDRALPHNCTPSCVVTVIVPAGCGSGIRVAPDPIVVKKGQASTIRWNVTGRWQFDRDGIYVHQAGKAFVGHERASDGRTFTIQVNHGEAATWKYDVNLIGPDGAKCQLDPTVVNW